MEDDMMKGAQKQMIVLRTGGSRYFDEAYFVLKNEKRPKKSEKRDLVWEANRILEENDTKNASPCGKISRARWFLSGVVTGLTSGGLLLFALRLIGVTLP